MEDGQNLHTYTFSDHMYITCYVICACTYEAVDGIQSWGGCWNVLFLSVRAVEDADILYCGGPAHLKILWFRAKAQEVLNVLLRCM